MLLSPKRDGLEPSKPLPFFPLAESFPRTGSRQSVQQDLPWGKGQPAHLARLVNHPSHAACWPCHLPCHLHPNPTTKIPKLISTRLQPKLCCLQATSHCLPQLPSFLQATCVLHFKVTETYLKGLR